MLQAPEHLSYSARDALDRCAKAFFLARMARAPKRPALWLAGGSAVHKVTELLDLEQVRDLGKAWDHHFSEQLDLLREREKDESTWRQSRSEPIERWREMGLELCQGYASWRERVPWQIWVTPDGEPAIELDVSGHLPGCKREIKGYVDRVFYDPNLDKLTVVDIKSGTRQPESDAQFGTYAALLSAKYDVNITAGVAYMARKGALGKVFDLSKHTPDYVGTIYGRVEAQIDAGAFNPKLGSHCFNMCDVAASCYAYDGPLAERYDPDHPGHKPPF